MDRTAAGLSSFLLATPTIVLGLSFLLLAARLDFFPTGGMSSLDFDELGWPARLADLARHLVLPAIALALSSFPVVYRHARAAVGEVIDAPYLEAALARKTAMQPLEREQVPVVKAAVKAATFDAVKAGSATSMPSSPAMRRI